MLRPGGRFLIVDPCEGSTLLLRLWDRARARIAKLRAPPASTLAADVEIPHHEEGPINVPRILALLEQNGLEPTVAYWTHFEGAHRLPKQLARALVWAGSRPWRHRSGNIAYISGRKRPDVA